MATWNNKNVFYIFRKPVTFNGKDYFCQLTKEIYFCKKLDISCITDIRSKSIVNGLGFPFSMLVIFIYLFILYITVNGFCNMLF